MWNIAIYTPRVGITCSSQGVALGLVAPTGEGFGPYSYLTPAPTRRVGGNSRGAAPRLYSLLPQSYGMLTSRYEYDGSIRVPIGYFPILPLDSRCRSMAESAAAAAQAARHGRRTDGAGQRRVFEDFETALKSDACVKFQPNY